jgi:hypothetical protein|tara:strand:- start:6250 stop:7050 length:801 start_codon:yes stop_codon:yes gene_type:complete
MNGFVYQLTGMGHAELFVVSCFNLRKFWDGHITVFVEQADDSPIIAEITDSDLRVDVQRIPIAKCRRNSHMATKTTLWRHTTLGQAIYLDCDTLPVGPLDELFTTDLTLTTFSDWISTGKTVAKRIQQWEGVSPMIDDMVSRTKNIEPAINTGVFAWGAEYSHLYKWEDLCMVRPGNFLSDEIAMQLIYPDLPRVRLVDQRFNCSPTYGRGQEDVRLWHFHGKRRHLRKEEGKKLWLPAFREVLDANVANITRWVTTGDTNLRHHV